MSDMVKLRDLVVLRRGSSYKGNLVGQPGPALLGLGTINRNGGFRGENLRSYGGESPEKILLEPGDLYVSLKDVTHAADLLGAVARVPETVDVGRLTQDTIRLDVNDEAIDRGYLYLALLTPQYRSYCRARGTGTTNLDLSQTDFLSYEVHLPSRPEQQAVAEVLGALEEKLTANRKLLSRADSYIRGLYEALPVQSTRRIEEIASHRRHGVDPSSLSSETVYVGLEHIPRRSIWLDGGATAADVTSGKSAFQVGDILFGKLRPYFHKVSRAATSGICSTDVLVLRTSVSGLEGFVLAAVSSDAVVESVTASSEGTRMPRTSWSDLSAVAVPWPGLDFALEFSRQVMALAEAMQVTLHENQTLAALRDTLLPPLMSGKLRVRDAERAVSEVL